MIGRKNLKVILEGSRHFHRLLPLVSLIVLIPQLFHYSSFLILKHSLCFMCRCNNIIGRMCIYKAQAVNSKFCRQILVSDYIYTYVYTYIYLYLLSFRFTLSNLEAVRHWFKIPVFWCLLFLLFLFLLFIYLFLFIFFHLDFEQQKTN